MLRTTDRLEFREFAEDDWQAVHDYASDAEVARFMQWGPNTEQDTQEFVRKAIDGSRARPRRRYELAICLRDTGRVIGGGALVVSDPDSRRGWIGYCLNRNYWNQGLGTETARALVAFGFERLDLHRIFATCDSDNNASRRVLEKAGMTREGLLREEKWVKGRWRDSLVYGILAGEVQHRTLTV